jgi:hypothetical protein
MRPLAIAKTVPTHVHSQERRLGILRRFLPEHDVLLTLISHDGEGEESPRHEGGKMNKRILATVVASTLGLGGVAIVATTASAAVTPSAVVRHDGAGRSVDQATHRANEKALADLLKLTTDELHTQMHSGKSLAQIAEAQGVQVSKVIDLLVSQATERITTMVNTVPPQRPMINGGRRHGRGHGNTSTPESVTPEGA